MPELDWWVTHGMLEDSEVVDDALDTLMLSPDELMALADYNEKERWIWNEMEKHFKRKGETEDAEKAARIHEYHMRRGRKWKELAARVDEEISKDEGDDDGD